MKLNGAHHLTLTVTDVERTAEWYRTVLGFQEVVRYRNDAISADCQVLAHPDAAPPTIGLRQYDGAGDDAFDEHRVGLDHLAFGVGDATAVASWQEHLQSLGVACDVSIDAAGRIALPSDR